MCLARLTVGLLAFRNKYYKYSRQCFRNKCVLTVCLTLKYIRQCFRNKCVLTVCLTLMRSQLDLNLAWVSWLHSKSQAEKANPVDFSPKPHSSISHVQRPHVQLDRRLVVVKAIHAKHASTFDQLVSSGHWFLLFGLVRSVPDYC